MKKLTTCAIALIFKFAIVYGQIDSSWVDNWEKILITDSYGGWSHFNNDYQILRKNLLLTPQPRPDSIIKQVNFGLIDSLFHSIKNDTKLKYDPLLMFGLDSTWLIKNAEILWAEYLDDRKESGEINSIAINALKDYSKIKRVIWSLQGSHWTDDYPYVSLSIVKGLDTLSISSLGQYPYMLPWHVDGKAIYNSRISQLISELLPDSSKSNKSRLKGELFNHYLIDRIYISYIKDKVDFVKAKDRYERQFRYLEKDFEIKHAMMSHMSSIEWGGWFGRPSLQLLLSDSTISNRIHFSTVFGRHSIIHSPKSIVKNKDKLISRLEDNPVYNYTLNCENCIGEIHWVQSKSLSGEAKRNFLGDLKENGLNKGKFRGKFKMAVFFELTEYRKSKRSFSRWIFLKDGTIVLWEFRGNYLMNLPESMTLSEGYICKTLSPEELITRLKTQ